MPVVTRPLTQTERQVLETMSQNPWTWKELFKIFLYCSFFTIFLIIMLWRIMAIFNIAPKIQSAYFYLIIISVVVGWGIFLIPKHLKQREQFSDTLYKQDLKNGVAEIRYYAPTNVIKVEQEFYEGSNYFLLLPDQSVLFLSGEYMRKLEKEQKFPCNNFTIVRAYHSQAFLDLICNGIYLPPSKILKSFKLDLLEKGEIPNDGDVISIRWEDIENKYITPPSQKAQNKWYRFLK